MALFFGAAARTPMRDDLRRLPNQSIDSYLSALASLVAYWPGHDTSGQLLTVINNAFTEGRNLLANGGFGSTANWTLEAGISIASGVVHWSGAGAGNATQANVLQAGLIYKVVYTTLNVSAGGVLIRLGSTNTGALRTTNGTFTEYIVADAGTFTIRGNATFVGDVDNVTCQLVDIKASSYFPTLEMVKNGGFDYSTAGWSGANWGLSSGKLLHTPGATTSAGQATTPSICPTLVGRSYTLVYTVSGRTAGSVTGKVGTTGAGTARSTNATFTETIVCAGTVGLYFTPDSAFDGSIDDISLVPADGAVLWDGSSTTATPTIWTVNGGVTVTTPAASGGFGTGNVLRVVRGATTNGSASQSCLKIGCTYHLTGIMRSQDGVGIPMVRINGVNVIVGTTSTSAQTIDYVFIAPAIGVGFGLTNTSGTNIVEFDDLVLVEIAPMTGVISGATLGASTSNPRVDTVLSLDGVNDGVNAFSPAFNAAVNPNFFSLTGYFNYTAGTSRQLFRALFDTDNYIQVQITSTGNIQAQHVGSGTIATSSVAVAGYTGTNHMYTLTVDNVAGELKFYIDDQLIGTVSTIGVLEGSFSSGALMIGAQTSSLTNSFDGYLGHVTFRNSVMTQAEVATEAMLMGVA